MISALNASEGGAAAAQQQQQPGLQEAQCLVVLLLWTLVLFFGSLFVLQKGNASSASSSSSWKRRKGRNNKCGSSSSQGTDLSTNSTTAHSKKQQEQYRQQQVQIQRKLDFLRRLQDDEYGYASSKAGCIDTWRSRELPRLIPPINIHPNVIDDDTNINSKKPQQQQDDDDNQQETPREVYLDFAGAGLPWKSQLQRLFNNNDDEMQILGNPHSTGGPAASRTARFMEQAKKRLLDLFNAHPSSAYHYNMQQQQDNADDSTTGSIHDNNIMNHSHPGYEIIFTTGTTDALRIVAECFPWKSAAARSSESESESSPRCTRSGYASSSKFVYPMQSHTSVIGMRGPALQAGATFHCRPLHHLLNDIMNYSHDDDDDDLLYSQDHDEDCDQNDDPQQRNTKTDGCSSHSNCPCNCSSSSTNNKNKHVNDEDDSSSTSSAVHDVAVLDEHGTRTTTTTTIPHLVVLPLECNFGGTRISTTTIQAVGRALQRRSSVATSSTTQNTASKRPRRHCRHCDCAAAFAHHEWFLLLDLAKAASTGPVNLKQLNPDFACISFYKLFGEPTGLGCLFVKRSCHSSFNSSLHNNGKNAKMPTKSGMSTTCTATVAALQHHHPDYSYFGGGSVQVVLPRRDFVIRKRQQETSVIDENQDGFLSSHDYILSKMATTAASRSSSGGGGGTVHYRGIVALLHGFDVLDSLGGMLAIQRHAACLAVESVQRLASMRHANGQKVVQLYGGWAQEQERQQEPEESKDNDKNSALRSDAVITNDIMPGPTVAFNLLRHDGSFVGYSEVSKLAALNHPYPIQLRTGCFCNPGACQLALGLDDDQVVENFAKHGHSCGDAMDIIDGRPTGAIRASFGKDSIWEEVDALVTFIERLFVSNVNSTGAVGEGGGDDINHDDRWDAFPRRVVLSELYLFPIKSCAAQKVERWKLDTSSSSGKLLWDREFSLVDASGNAMRLQNYPAMALIQPTMNLESRVLTVNAPGKPTLEIQLQEDYLYEQEQQRHNVRKSTIKVCGKRCRGRVWGDVETSQWFSEHLGVQCWLARYVSGRYELPQSFLGNPPSTSAHHGSDVVAFANEQPILLISENAVDVLNEILSEQGQRLVSSKSFRPNMVVRVAGRPQQQSSNVHAEDGWTRVQLININNENSNMGNGYCGFVFDVVGQCARCSMVDVDPSTGLMKGKALRALADYRRSNGQIAFGIFLKGAKMEQAARTTTKKLETASQADVWIREGDMLLCQ